MTTQKPEIGKILTEAYQYWMRTLPFQFLFSAIYFGIFMFSAMYAFRYYGLFEEVQKFQNLFYTDTQAFLKKYEVLMQTPNALSFAMVVLVIAKYNIYQRFCLFYQSAKEKTTCRTESKNHSGRITFF